MAEIKQWSLYWFWRNGISSFLNTLWPEKREGGRVILARKWCVLSCQNRHIFGFINQKFYTSTMTESKWKCSQNKVPKINLWYICCVSGAPDSGLVTIMQSSAVQFSAYMLGHILNIGCIFVAEWRTLFSSDVFLNCQPSWLISTLSHVLGLINDKHWIKCWDFSPILHCKCIIWCFGWWEMGLTDISQKFC